MIYFSTRSYGELLRTGMRVRASLDNLTPRVLLCVRAELPLRARQLDSRWSGCWAADGSAFLQVSAMHGLARGSNLQPDTHSTPKLNPI